MERFFRAAALAGFLLACALAVAGEPHPGIVIAGDDELCTLGSGVVNCGSADGTPDNPYIIEGWTISSEGTGGCGWALLSICDVDAHVLVRDVDLSAPLFSPPFLFEESNVTVEAVSIVAEFGSARVDGGRVHVVNSTFSSQADPALFADGHLAFRNAELWLRGQTGIHNSAYLEMHGGSLKGAISRGLQNFGGTAIIEGTSFSENGMTRIPGPVAVTYGDPADITVSNIGVLEVRDAHFDVRSVGIRVMTADRVFVTGTVFDAPDARPAIEIDVASGPCPVEATYNAFLVPPSHSIRNACAVDFPDNWWGSPSGPPQGWADDQVYASSWLTKPLDQLPVLELEAWVEGPEVVLEGSTDGDHLKIILPTGTQEIPVESPFTVRIPAVSALDVQACDSVCSAPLTVHPAPRLAVSNAASLSGFWIGGGALLLVIVGVVGGVLLRPHPRRAQLEELHARVAELVPDEVDGVDMQGMVLGVAHDLKGPLAGIIAMLQVAEREARDGQPVEDLLRQALAGSQHLKELVFDLLEMARVGSEPTINSADIRDIVGHALSGPAIPDQVEVRTGGPSVPLATDTRRVARLLRNLIENSARYAPEGKACRVDITWSVAGQALEMVIVDNGPGLPAHIERRLWAPFNTTGGEGSSGLGLSIVKGLVESIGGTVRYRTRGGAEFTIRLPL